jgi:hypothetical protein
MPTLRQNYNLLYKDMIRAIIIANNDRGQSLPSLPNSLAPIVQDVPLKMDPIT